MFSSFISSFSLKLLEQCQFFIREARYAGLCIPVVFCQVEVDRLEVEADGTRYHRNPTLSSYQPILACPYLNGAFQFLMPSVADAILLIPDHSAVVSGDKLTPK